MKICITGHRPKKLYGYDLSDPRWIRIKENFKELLLKYKCEEAITGMALGVDTVFALAVLELKDQGVDIKLHCAIPCKNHPGRWKRDSVKLYDSILNRADIVKIVTDAEYQPWMMKVRNEYMVDLSDMVIAVWDGSRSGTGNCVEYARRMGREVKMIIPEGSN